MDIKDIRAQIDAVDNQLVSLFIQRMQLSAQVADYKKERDLPIFVPEREQQILEDVANKAGESMASYTKALYSTIFELSRNYQRERNNEVAE